MHRFILMKKKLVISVIGVLAFNLSCFGMDLSILSAEFQKIQPHPVRSNLPKGQAYLTDSSLSEEADVRALLPQSYARLNFIPKRQEQKDLQNLMDEVFLKVVQTPTGSKLCTEASGGQPEISSMIFGVSYDLARSTQTCGKPEQNWPDAWLKSNSTKRRYSFILYEGEPTKAQGWTTKEGKTFFFLRQQDVTPAHFFRLYIHELAMYVQGNSLEDLRLQGSTSYFLNSPLIQQAMKLAKAYEIEDQILKELGADVRFSNERCTQKIESAIDELQAFTPFFKEEERAYYLRNSQKLSAAYGQIPRFEELDPKFALQFLERHPELCEAALRPKFNNVIDSEGPRGPRPRVGNGTGLSGKQVQKIESQISSDLKNIAVEPKVPPTAAETAEKMKVPNIVKIKIYLEKSTQQKDAP